MSVVAAYAYVDGKRSRALRLDDPESLQVREGEFIWIGLLEPCETELRIEHFHLHPLAIEDTLSARQMPKVLAVPTAIAGLYGMNFEYMPELHWRYG